VKGFYDWVGVTNEYVMRGKNAGLFRETKNGRRRTRQNARAGNSIYYNNFIPKVAKGRGKTDEEVNSASVKGRVWTGAQAKQNGLIDEFGGLEKAIEIAKELANLPADKDVRRVNYPEPRSFFESVFGGGVAAETEEQKAQKAVIQRLARRRSQNSALRFDARQDETRRSDDDDAV
jgi:protease-4